MSRPATKPATIEISVTVDAELLAAIDALVERFPDLGRAEVIDEALRMWYRRELAAAQQFASPLSPKEQEEHGAWRRIQAAAAERIFQER
jgi:hypothetical protein